MYRPWSHRSADPSFEEEDAVIEQSHAARWTGVVVPAAVAVAVLFAVGAGPARSSTATQARTTNVTVVMKEFRFILSKRSVRAGTVVFQLENKGHIPHDFKIAGKKSKLVQPGKKSTLRVVFRHAGRYPYLCTVPGHAQAGMKGVLRVTR
jgi:uncharacterized cupredoxin-like copper-binding protein